MSWSKIGCTLAAGALFLSCVAAGDAVALSQSEKNDAQSLAHYMMGLFHDWNNEVPQAIEEFKQAEERDKENFFIHLRLGINYARLGKIPEAVEELKVATRINPQDLQSHYLLALLYASMKNNLAANQEYETILETLSREEPGNIQVQLYLGQFYFQQGRYDEAMGCFQGALKIDGNNIDALFLLGSLLEIKGRDEEAIKYFKDVLKIDSGHSASLNSLGYIYARQGRHLDEAVELIRRALEAEPDNGAYVDSLGWAIFKKAVRENDPQLLQESVILLEKAQGLLSDPEILSHLGEAYLRSGETIKAKAAWQRALEIDPAQKELKEKLERIKLMK